MDEKWVLRVMTICPRDVRIEELLHIYGVVDVTTSMSVTEDE